MMKISISMPCCKTMETFDAIITISTRYVTMRNHTHTHTHAHTHTHTHTHTDT